MLPTDTHRAQQAQQGAQTFPLSPHARTHGAVIGEKTVALVAHATNGRFPNRRFLRKYGFLRHLHADTNNTQSATPGKCNLLRAGRYAIDPWLRGRREGEKHVFHLLRGAPYTPSELATEREAILAEQAKARQKEAGSQQGGRGKEGGRGKKKKKPPVPKSAQGVSTKPKPKTVEVSAKSAGVGKDTYDTYRKANQLGRRNITPELFRYVLGRRYNRTKKRSGGTGANQHKQGGKSYHSAKTAEQLAEECGVTEKTVRNYGKFQEEVDAEGVKDPIWNRIERAKASKFKRSRRRDLLSFKHHQAVASLEPEDAKEFSTSASNRKPASDFTPTKSCASARFHTNTHTPDPEITAWKPPR